MQNRKKYLEYLKDHYKFIDSTLIKYTEYYHNTLEKKLGISFYDIESIDKLEELLSKVKELEETEYANHNRAYSSTLKKYIEFKKKDIENKIELSEDEYMSLIEIFLSTFYESNPSKRSITLSSYKRNIEISAFALVNSNFTCEINKDHTFFISKKTKRSYMEAHHIIPISAQSKFDHNLDILPNIVSLCPICHKQLHHGTKDDRDKILIKLWDKRNILLKKNGFTLSFDDLSQLYD